MELDGLGCDLINNAIFMMSRWILHIYELTTPLKKVECGALDEIK